MTEVKSLNQRIAEAFGWTEIELQSTWSDRPHYGFEEWQALRGVPPDKTEREWIPYWEHSLDAVADVLPEDYDLIILRQIGGGYSAKIRRDMLDMKLQEWRGYGATRKEAAANALLEYVTWKKDEGEGE